MSDPAAAELPFDTLILFVALICRLRPALQDATNSRPPACLPDHVVVFLSSALDVSDTRVRLAWLKYMHSVWDSNFDCAGLHRCAQAFLDHGLSSNLGTHLHSLCFFVLMDVG
jgi:hypothetical protein